MEKKTAFKSIFKRLSFPWEVREMEWKNGFIYISLAVVLFLHVHKNEPSAQVYSHESMAFLHQVTSPTSTLSWGKKAFIKM